MIMNPSKVFYQYNPYNKQFTEEVYDTVKMHEIRKSEVEKAKGAKLWGLILGTLGR
jgi:2-(3-amino-3-carboxypropyl)histidine synthase